MSYKNSFILIFATKLTLKSNMDLFCILNTNSPNTPFMKFKYTLIVVLLTQLMHSQNIPTDLAKMNLKGKITSVQEVEDKMPSTIPDGADFNSRIERTLYLVNEKGYSTEKKVMVNGKFYSKRKMYYTASNQVIQTEDYNENDSITDYGDLGYEYDKNGKMSRVFSPTSSTTYETQVVPQTDSKLLVTYSYEDNGTKVKNYERVENTKGEIIEERSYIHDKLYTETLYAFNAKGLLSKKTDKHYWNGSVTYTAQEFVYNSNDDVVKIKTLNEGNTVVNEENIKYEYDKRGNWIKKESEGVDHISTKRAIGYKL